MTTILFNPLADNGRGRENLQKLTAKLDGQIALVDITQADAVAVLERAQTADSVILTGGDGTLHRFVNALGGRVPAHPVYYFPTGSGNDFWNDIREAASVNGMVLLNPYLSGLPSVTVNGRTVRFLNGVGYGIDGYCCEEGDRLRASSGGRVNYTAIAIKGLLFHFKPRNATVTVDGVPHSFRRVWLAPTMLGRYYGGGMQVAPGRDRKRDGDTVSVVVMHGSGKLKTLMVFPSIFKGEHVRHTEMVTVLTGREITVRFDRPTALQIDGETVSGVTEYRVRTAASIHRTQPAAMC